MSRGTIVNLETFIANVPSGAHNLTCRTKAAAPITLLDFPAKEVAATSPREQAQSMYQSGREWAETAGGEVTFIVQFLTEDERVIVATQFRAGGEDPNATGWEQGTPEGVISQLQTLVTQFAKINMETTRQMQRSYGDIIEMQAARIKALEGERSELEETNATVVDALAEMDESDGKFANLVEKAESLIARHIDRKLEAQTSGSKKANSAKPAETKAPADAPPAEDPSKESGAVAPEKNAATPSD